MPLSHTDDSFPFDRQLEQPETETEIKPRAPTSPAKPPASPASPAKPDKSNGEAKAHPAVVTPTIPVVVGAAVPELSVPDLKVGGSKSFIVPAASDALPSDLPPDFGVGIVLDSTGGKKKVSLKDLLTFQGDTDIIKPILSNVITILTHDKAWWDVLAWDSFNQTIVLRRATPWNKPKGSRWSDMDDSELTNWLQCQLPGKLTVSSPLVSEAVGVAAQRYPIHPVRDYLKSLRWDGHSRLEEWLSKWMGADDKPIIRAFASKWLISAVARVMKPGEQVDHTLLLEGAQGTRKSTALRTLAGDEWFTDHISDLHDKDSRMELQGKWIVELSELHAIKGKGMEAVKSFLTTRVDSFRAPYARYTQSIPRQCVFAATTNDDQALTDETGNRRFWPIHCGEIDIPGLASERDQLWAEAYASWKAKKAWWLDSQDLVAMAEREQSSHYQTGLWDERIESWLNNPQPLSSSDSIFNPITSAGEPLDPFMSELGKVTINDILTHALRLAEGERKGRPDMVVGRYLKFTGWKRVQEGKGEHRGKWFWIKKLQR
jgi:putative DNA primase/helicase